MSNAMHYAYQHTNGQFIYKVAGVVDCFPGGAHEYFESPFVARWWKQLESETLEEFKKRIGDADER